MKNIYCVVGRSGCGKTTLVESLERDYGYKSVQSYTTRKPRYDGETGHIFVSPEEFHQLGEMVAYTLFNGAEYGVTSDLLESNELYVIDVAGVRCLREKYLGEKGIKVIGIEVPRKNLYDRMIRRGDKEEKALERIVHDNNAFADMYDVCDIVLDGTLSPAALVKKTREFINEQECEKCCNEGVVS